MRYYVALHCFKNNVHLFYLNNFNTHQPVSAWDEDHILILEGPYENYTSRQLLTLIPSLKRMIFESDDNPRKGREKKSKPITPRVSSKSGGSALDVEDFSNKDNEGGVGIMVLENKAFSLHYVVLKFKFQELPSQEKCNRLIEEVSDRYSPLTSGQKKSNI